MNIRAMRLFVGIPVAGGALAALGGALERWRQAFPELRWEDVRDLHVTLQFIGAFPAGREHTLTTALEAIALPRCTLQVAGLGGFPSLRRPRALWAGVAAHPELIKLAEAVALQLGGLGIVREERAYTPHITLARARSTGPMPSDAPEIWGDCPVAGFQLYETLPAPLSRPRYRVLHRFA
ncbi:MAG: RNA 2',3'-cyclic phosphodiesterase [Terriglobales bacterium]